MLVGASENEPAVTPSKEALDSTLRELAGRGLGTRAIAKELATQGIQVSHMTIARRLRTLA